MSVAGITASSVNPALIAAQRASDAADSPKPARTSALNDPASVKKAASQFEAIILRQLLAPAIEPIMSGGIGGEKSAGGGIYGYMMTDVLANDLSKGSGLGLAKMLEKQFTSRDAAAAVKSAHSLKSQPLSVKSP